MIRNTHVYSAVTVGVAFTTRVLPLTLIHRQITNRFPRPFLYYVPYVALAVMTFLTILNATQAPVSGALALVAGIALVWCGTSLFKVSASCCMVVFPAELLMRV